MWETGNKVEEKKDREEGFNRRWKKNKIKRMQERGQRNRYRTKKKGGEREVGIE